MIRSLANMTPLTKVWDRERKRRKGRSIKETGYVSGSTLGTGRWLRTKKYSLGVIMVPARISSGGSALNGFCELTLHRE